MICIYIYIYIYTHICVCVKVRLFNMALPYGYDAGVNVLESNIVENEFENQSPDYVHIWTTTLSHVVCMIKIVLFD